MKAPDYGRLVDPRTGLIRRLERVPIPPRLPRSLIIFGAEVANSIWPSLWTADRAAIGTSFEQEGHARQAAIGEMAERYCGNFVPAGLRRASYAQLVQAGENALNPESVNFYSESQYRSPGFPFARFTPDLEVLWVEGEDMETGAPALIPASLVYTNYFFGPRRDIEPPTNHLIYAGIAAGPSRRAAEGAALEEAVERDATMIWWQSGSSAIGLDVAEDPVLRSSILPGDGSGSVRYHFIQIPTSFDVPVVGALLEDTDLNVITLGVACRPDPTAAALKALAESVSLWFFSNGLLDPEGDVWYSVSQGWYESRQFHAYRADRRYMDSFSPDYREIVDLGGQSQFYLDPRARQYVERILSPAKRRPIGSVPSHGGADRHELYLRRLLDRGFRAYSVDITTADVRAAGLSVIRVVVPGLYSNSPAAFPLLGGKRLYEEPATMGLVPGRLSEQDLVLAPLPHT